MDSFQERVVRVGLAAGERQGFALAGGLAIQAHGLTDRPSEDVDLFTTAQAVGDFPAAVEEIATAFCEAGWSVTRDREGTSFAALRVAGADGLIMKVELAVDWRSLPPARMEIGPVLHRDDAVANKMTALYGRYEVRDFIDVDAALRSGAYTRADLLRLAAEHDPGFEPGLFAEALGTLDLIPDAEFFAYGLTESAHCRARRGLCPMAR